MDAAEITAYRHLVGLTASQLAERLDNHERAIRQREAGTRGIPDGVADEVLAMAFEHGELAQAMADAGTVEIPYAADDRGWLVAAAARALALNPALVVRWSDGPR